MATQNLISDTYKQQLQGLHSQKKWGTAGRHHAAMIADFANKITARTILDFGCGRATLRPTLISMGQHHFNVFEYDPGIPEIDRLPEHPCDLLVATDVLEHIEPSYLDATLNTMKSFARKGMFLIIATKKAKETLPDGRNAHLIQKPPNWWNSRLMEHGLVPVQVIVKGSAVYAWITMENVK